MAKLKAEKMAQKMEYAKAATKVEKMDSGSAELMVGW